MQTYHTAASIRANFDVNHVKDTAGNALKIGDFVKVIETSPFNSKLRKGKVFIIRGFANSINDELFVYLTSLSQLIKFGDGMDPSKLRQVIYDRANDAYVEEQLL